MFRRYERPVLTLTTLSTLIQGNAGQAEDEVAEAYEIINELQQGDTSRVSQLTALLDQLIDDLETLKRYEERLEHKEIRTVEELIKLTLEKHILRHFGEENRRKAKEVLRYINTRLDEHYLDEKALRKQGRIRKTKVKRATTDTDSLIREVGQQAKASGTVRSRIHEEVQELKDEIAKQDNIDELDKRELAETFTSVLTRIHSLFEHLNEIEEDTDLVELQLLQKLNDLSVSDKELQHSIERFQQQVKRLARKDEKDRKIQRRRDGKRLKRVRKAMDNLEGPDVTAEIRKRQSDRSAYFDPLPPASDMQEEDQIATLLEDSIRPKLDRLLLALEREEYFSEQTATQLIQQTMTALDEVEAINELLNDKSDGQAFETHWEKLRKAIDKLRWDVPKAGGEFRHAVEHVQKSVDQEIRWLNVRDAEDRKQFKQMLHTGIFSNRLFARLHHEAGMLLHDQCVTPEQLRSTLSRLSKKRERRAFFSTVRTIRKYTENHESVFYHIHELFNTEAATVLKRWSQILDTEDREDSTGANASHFFTAKQVVNDLQTPDISLTVEEYLHGLKLFASTRLQLPDPSMKVLQGIPFTEELARIVHRFPIRYASEFKDVKRLYTIAEILIQSEWTKDEVNRAAKLWEAMVREEVHGIPYVQIYIRAVDRFGLTYFEERQDMLNLSTDDFHALHHAMKDNPNEDEHAWTQFQQSFRSDGAILVCIATEDHNNGHSEAFARSLKLPDQQDNVHIHKVRSVQEVAHYIATYGDRKPISKFIIVGHATESFITLSKDEGIDSEKGRISHDTVGAFEGLSRYFSDNAEGYLYACSAGKGAHSTVRNTLSRLGFDIRPIGQEIANHLEIPITAATRVTAGKIAMEDGELVVEYESVEDGEGQRADQGEEQENRTIRVTPDQDDTIMQEFFNFFR